MITLVVTSLIALIIGGSVGFLIEKAIAASQVVSIRTQLQSVNAECEHLRDRLQNALTAEATALAERAAAVGAMAKAEAEIQRTFEKVENQSAELRLAHIENANLNSSVVGLEAQLKAKDEELARQKIWFGEQSEHLQSLFATTANRLLEERAAKFGEQNKEQLDGLLNPFRAQLTDFRQRVDQIHTDETNAQGRLQSEIANLAETASQVGTKADQLANAMLGNVKQQGEWGQLQLTVLLEKAGFVEGKHFENQLTGANDENEMRIADTVLALPNNETLVIDAKVSLPSWNRFCASESPQEREMALKEMVTSLKTHYTGLANKDYARIVGKGRSVPFTVMFIPIEPAGIEAFKAAPELFNDAQRRKIIIVTPTTLFCVLQLVSAMWNIHDKQTNALDIANQGRLLLKKLGSFVDSFMNVGGSLESAIASFEKAKGQLTTGRGSLITLAHRMSDLGVEAPQTGELSKLILNASQDSEGEVIPMPHLAISAD